MLILKTGYVKNYEVTFKKKNGETIPILLTTQTIKNEKGEVVGYQGLNIDISERIRMEQELREKHGFLTSSDISRGMCHEDRRRSRRTSRGCCSRTARRPRSRARRPPR